MKTREESLNTFCDLMDKLMTSKYLLASSGIFDVLTLINSSKLLSDMFNYFSEGFDFEETLTNSFYMEDGVKHCKIPSDSTQMLPFVYTILKEINFKNLQLSDLLDFFEGGKNYEASYKNFAYEVLLPFKSYVNQIATQMILASNAESEEANASVSSEKEVVEESKQVEFTKIENSVDFSIKSTITENYATLRRLVDLDKLSISQSRLSEDEKEELRYVLGVFESEIIGGDSAKIKLSYLAYYYAMRPFKKVKNNVKTITEILINSDIL